jgi:glycosyltransferase involved in cell wall biosynthesis
MKILFICDSVSDKFSGGKVIRYLCDILTNFGNHEIKVVVVNNNVDNYIAENDFFCKRYDVSFISQRTKFKYTISNFLHTTKGLKLFRTIVKEFTPDIVHFASFDSEKSPLFITESNKVGAKVILQPWTMDFYCARKYAFINNHQCTLCANGKFKNAIQNNCINYKSIFSLKRRLELKRAAKQADMFLSSNCDLDKILLDYGIDKNKIQRFPIPFDYRTISQKFDNEVSSSNEFVFYGLPKPWKGMNFLFNFFSLRKNYFVKILPSQFVEQASRDNIKIINNLSWEKGLRDEICSSRAVLIPSLWATTTEYSIYEAFALRKPVIAFNVGVHKDILKDKFNALVVEPNDYSSFENALLNLQNDVVLSNKLSKNGYKTLLNINDPEKLYSKLMSIYNS